MASKCSVEEIISRQHGPGPSENQSSLSGGQSVGEQPHHVEFTADATERGSPPTYEEAMDPAAAPPPSYDSLFGRVREVHKESSGTVDFIRNVIILLAGTIGCTIIIAVTIVIPVSMVIVGSMYLHDCPVNYRIPLYLIVGGAFGILKQVLHLIKRCKRRNRTTNEEEEEKSSALQNGMSCFITGWFILGSFWVYKEYKPSFDPSLDTYCNRTVYLFAFWQITVVYIVIGIVALCLCSVSLAVVAFTRKHERVTSPS